MSLSLISRSCPVCDSTRQRPYLQKGELRLVQCAACSMIYASPVDPVYASGQYYQSAGAEYYLSSGKLESDYADVRFERELHLFRRHCGGGAVLDVGCSSGGFLFQLKQRFPNSYNLLGTDVSGPALDYAASRGVPIVTGNFLEQQFGGRAFDALTFWAVLEHLAEPSLFLQKGWTLLKPGGLCFVLVPNMESLAVRVLGSRYRYVYPQHLNYFTARTLTQLVSTRFTVVERHSTHFNPVVIWQDLRSGGADVSNTERARLLRRTTTLKQNPLLRPARAIYSAAENLLGAFNLGDNLVMVLRKA